MRPISFRPVWLQATDEFDAVYKRMTAAKGTIAKKHQAPLEERYDPADHPVAAVAGRPGVRLGVIYSHRRDQCKL